MIVLAAAVALAPRQIAMAREPEPPPPARFEHDMIVRFHMHENFDLLRAIEKLLLRGRLDDAKALAQAIAEAPDEPGLGALAPHAIRVRDQAANLARAPTVDEACRREARLAVACAGCHVETGVMPALSSLPPIPPDRNTIEARMARHLWATDRLWEAVVGGGNEPWVNGLDVLSATPFPFRAALDDRAGLAKQLQQVASAARKRSSKDDLTERGRVYGQILTICATCHTSSTITKLPSEK